MTDLTCAHCIKKRLKEIEAVVADLPISPLAETEVQKLKTEHQDLTEALSKLPST